MKTRLFRIVLFTSLLFTIPTVSIALKDNCQVTATAVLPLPTNAYQFADHVVKFVFTNTCAAATTLGTMNLNATQTGGLTKGDDNCSNQSLMPNTSCSVYASVIPQTVGSLNVSASVSYATPDGAEASAAVTTTSTITAIDTTAHHIIFVNQCPFPVWYGISNGGPGSDHADPTLLDGATSASTDDYALAAQDSDQIPVLNKQIKQLDMQAGAQYEHGVFWARTGCNVVTDPQTQEPHLVCATGSCTTIVKNGQATGTCVPEPTYGYQPKEPFTRFEAYIAPTPATTAGTGDQQYNVSIINGFNVPVEVKPLGNVSPQGLSEPAPFDCAGAGALIQPQQSPTPTLGNLGSCAWSFTPPTTAPDGPAENFILVSSGKDDTDCTSTGTKSCPSGEICGMAFDQLNPEGGIPPIHKRCGVFQGYWTAVDFNAFTDPNQWGTHNLYHYYDFKTALPIGPQGSYGTVAGQPATKFAMYGCTPTDNNSLNTGYSFKTNVCGCYNWNKADGKAHTAQTDNCKDNADNADWEKIVFPKISWLKQACPTAYAYQFDDKSSSFQCNPTQGGFTSYQVTFCPGGKTGAPGN